MHWIKKFITNKSISHIYFSDWSLLFLYSKLKFKSATTKQCTVGYLVGVWGNEIHWLNFRTCLLRLIYLCKLIPRGIDRCFSVLLNFHSNIYIFMEISPEYKLIFLSLLDKTPDNSVKNSLFYHPILWSSSPGY